MEHDISPGWSLIGRGDRVVVNLFDDPSRVAQAFGLAITLPDVNNSDPAYWEQVHAGGGYKRRVEGKIADPWWQGDPDWALLLRLPWCEVWFDIEEGVKLFLVAEDVPRLSLLLQSLPDKGVRIRDDDGRALVWVTPVVLGDDSLARVRTRLEAAGFVQGRNEIVWEPPAERG